MIRLYNYYSGYRRVGLGRLDALRFAWLVAGSGLRPLPLRQTIKR